MHIKKDNVRSIYKWHGYYIEDTDCSLCRFYAKKKGCTLDKCCCLNEKEEAIKAGRIKRERRASRWDM